jgi:hypothetical protein
MIILRPEVELIPMLTPARYQADWPWHHLERALRHYAEDYTLDLDPDFQRDFVWTERQRTAFVEHCLRGGTYGRTLYFNAPGWPEFDDGDLTIELVDGKQRLAAARDFMAGELKVFGGWTLGDFDEPERLRRMNQCFHFAINGLRTRAEVLQWYLDINAGGTAHSEDELDRVRGLLAEELGRAPG